MHVLLVSESPFKLLSWRSFFFGPERVYVTHRGGQPNNPFAFLSIVLASHMSFLILFSSCGFLRRQNISFQVATLSSSGISLPFCRLRSGLPSFSSGSFPPIGVDAFFSNSAKGRLPSSPSPFGSSLLAFRRCYYPPISFFFLDTCSRYPVYLQQPCSTLLATRHRRPSPGLCPPPDSAERNQPSYHETRSFSTIPSHTTHPPRPQTYATPRPAHVRLAKGDIFNDSSSCFLS